MITFMKEYTSDVYSFVRNSKYVKGGHSIIFSINSNDMILIKEIFIVETTVKNKERRVSIREAIEFQKKLRKFGYDKIS